MYHMVVVVDQVASPDPMEIDEENDNLAVNGKRSNLLKKQETRRRKRNSSLTIYVLLFIPNLYYLL
ncbi:hypothetical protein CN505_20445 [Bacillus cereus]|nr:hypothetical protein CN509_09180 [Bacillus cereus]PET02905.1 hypothetical protein CN505_20445 [Bacillus cereus]